MIFEPRWRADLKMFFDMEGAVDLSLIPWQLIRFSSSAES